MDAAPSVRPMKPPRSNYAPRLAEYPTIALHDVDAVARRERWREHFRERVGAAFDGRVYLEIGTADADLLTRVAIEHPRSAFVGLDWKCKALHDGAARLAGLGVRNVALVRGRAQEIGRLFDDGELSGVWVFHPDPCDRPAELPNRLVCESFLMDVCRTLAPGVSSSFVLKTDHAGYFQWTLALLGQPMPSWMGGEPTTDVAPRFTRPRLVDLMRASDLPMPSESVRRAFAIACVSDDLWHDAAARARLAHHPFAARRTRFEERFVAKRQPIFYVELVSRRPDPSAAK